MSDSGESDESSAIEDEFDLDIVALEEARRTIDKQNEVLNNIDDKAARILRINLVIVGLLTTGLSISIGDGTSQSDSVRELLPDILNIYTELGMLSLLLSTALAALTYTASASRIGLTGGGLKKMIFEGDAPDRKRLRGLIDSYSTWIERNYRTNAYNAPLATATLLLLVYAVTLLVLGGIETIRGVQSLEITGAVIFLGLFTYSTGIISQVKRYKQSRGNTNASGGER